MTDLVTNAGRYPPHRLLLRHPTNAYYFSSSESGQPLLVRKSKHSLRRLPAQPSSLFLKLAGILHESGCHLFAYAVAGLKGLRRVQGSPLPLAKLTETFQGVLCPSNVSCF